MLGNYSIGESKWKMWNKVSSFRDEPCFKENRVLTCTLPNNYTRTWQIFKPDFLENAASQFYCSRLSSYFTLSFIIYGNNTLGYTELIYIFAYKKIKRLRLQLKLEKFNFVIVKIRLFRSKRRFEEYINYVKQNIDINGRVIYVNAVSKLSFTRLNVENVTMPQISHRNINFGTLHSPPPPFSLFGTVYEFIKHFTYK